MLGGILEGVLDNLFVTGRRDRGLERLIAEGERVPAQVYAIKVHDTSDSGEVWLLGLDLQTSGGPLRASVRQKPIPHGELVTLGAHVVAVHRNGRVAIDWPETLRQRGLEAGPASILAGRTTRKPLEPGIQDNRVNAKRLREWTPATASVVSLTDTVVLGMPTENVNLELDVDGRRLSKRSALVPRYARLALEPGAALPIAIHPSKPDKFEIDWITFACG